MAGPIRITILGNASQAKKELTGFAKTVDDFGGKFSKLRAPAAAFLGAVGLGAKKAVGDASDLNETLAKSGEIFGPNLKIVEKFASGASKTIGQSKRAAMDAAATFGLIGQKAGLSGEESAKFGVKFTKLASDMASFNNTSPEEAVEAIGAAMRGESEPIRKYGVLLDDATLRARAMKMGLIDTVKKALTPQQKALAASAEIMAQTSKAQGDFARTADGAANKQRTLAAQSEDLSASLGQSLLPAYQSVLSIASQFAAGLAANPTVTKAVIIGLTALAAAVIAVSVAAKVVTAATTAYTAAGKIATAVVKVWTIAQKALGKAMIPLPILIAVAAIAAVVAIVVIAYKRSDKFRRIVDKAWNAIKNVTKAVWPAVTKAIGSAFRFLTRLFFNFTGPGLMIKHWNKIRSATKTAWQIIKSTVLAPVRTIVAVLRGDFGKAKQIMREATAVIKSVVRTAFNALPGIVRDKINAVVDWVRGLKDRAKSALSGASNWLWYAGRDMVQGLINGLKSMAGDIKYAAEKLVYDAVQAAKKWLKIGSPSKVMQQLGEWTSEGLAIGINKKAKLAARAATGLAGQVAKGFEAPNLTLDARPVLAAQGVLGSVSDLGGTTTVNINVTAPVGSSSADIGRTVVKHIKAYVSQGGERP